MQAETSARYPCLTEGILMAITKYGKSPNLLPLIPRARGLASTLSALSASSHTKPL